MPTPETRFGRCFFCGRVLKGPGIFVQVVDEDQKPWVGPECALKIRAAGADGIRPPGGGPRVAWIK